MKPLLIAFIVACATLHPLYGNDGAFYANGNQLIPIHETDIAVKKEVLRLTKTHDRYVLVSVYYEFHNPKAEKELLVGFEAKEPSGDVDLTAKANGHHPYIDGFTVNLNGQDLPYKVAKPDEKNGNNFVYHFNAKFKKGTNIVKHTYRYRLSGSVMFHYDIDYVLTAANRWANKQIDDFTLILDMGAFETFGVAKHFFSGNKGWRVDGAGKMDEVEQIGYVNDGNSPGAVRFHMKNGIAVFQQLNFRPRGELYIFANKYGYWGLQYGLPFSPHQVNVDGFDIDNASDDDRKLLRNLPFARRGYLFRDKQLAEYYSDQPWYMPDPDHVADLGTLWPMEREWLEKFK